MLKRPQPVNNRHVITRARAKADPVADFAGKNFDFALVSPARRRREMFRRFSSRLSRFDLIDDRVDSVVNFCVPVFFLLRRISANDERPIGAAPIAHVRGAAIGAINEIPYLDDAARSVETTIERGWPGAPPAGNRGFQAKLITGSRA